MTRSFSITRHGIPLLALAMLAFAGWSVAAEYRPRTVTSPPIAAPTSPYDDDIAGSGIVEPASEVIALATERGGVVTRVAVVAGDRVKAGQPLFAIDDRNYRATVAQDEASAATAIASIATIDQNLILQQDAIDQARANLEGAVAELTRAGLDLARYTHLVQDSWATRQRFEAATADADKANANVAAGKAALASAQQQNNVLLAQRKEAEAKLDQARAVLDGARADLDKTVTKAPIDGVILKVNVRLGEYASAGELSNPLMTMGSIDPLHVRVDVDETDAWRVRPDSPAIARLRGNPGIAVRLAFVRFEPYVLPKRSLTGDPTERVDTRVLQAIYAFHPGDFPAFIGQQVDVFIKAPTRPDGTQNPTPGLMAFRGAMLNTTGAAIGETQSQHAAADKGQ
jgi:multidrug resistance efflux pump